MAFSASIRRAITTQTAATLGCRTHATRLGCSRGQWTISCCTTKLLSSIAVMPRVQQPHKREVAVASSSVLRSGRSLLMTSCALTRTCAPSMILRSQRCTRVTPSQSRQKSFLLRPRLTSFQIRRLSTHLLGRWRSGCMNTWTRPFRFARLLKTSEPRVLRTTQPSFTRTSTSLVAKLSFGSFWARRLRSKLRDTTTTSIRTAST
mmetsp:Transcript_45641/g.97226  ORF Transcript_45641/g.97226 Transcript_45641/m.97226 type:complete len:205 (-) Transcript_45641:514-1128(-)